MSILLTKETKTWQEILVFSLLAAKAKSMDWVEIGFHSIQVWRTYPKEVVKGEGTVTSPLPWPHTECRWLIRVLSESLSNDQLIPLGIHSISVYRILCDASKEKMVSQKIENMCLSKLADTRLDSRTWRHGLSMLRLSCRLDFFLPKFKNMFKE